MDINSFANDSFDQFVNGSYAKFVVSGLTVVGSILIVLTLLGSTLIILTYHSEPKLQNLTNLWIVSMSFTDLILALLVMPVAILAGGFNQWIFSQFFCDIYIMMDVLCCTCSIYHLCLISLDRYLCITQPLSYPRRRTKTATCIAIAVCWLFCFALSLPPVIGWKNPRPEGECGISSWSYAVFSSVLSFYLPLVLILSAYIGMFKATKQQNKKFSTISQSVAAISRNVSRRMSRALSFRPQRPRKEETNYVDVEESIQEFQDHLTVKGNFKTQARSAPGSPTGSSSRGQFMNELLPAPNKLTIPIPRFESVSLDGAENTSPDSPNLQYHGLEASLKLLETTDVFRKISTSIGVKRIQRLPTMQGRNQKRLQKNRERQERKAGTVVAVVIVTFVSFWAPFFILNVVTGVCNCVSEYAFSVATWLGYANSALNPMIYSIFNRQFRSAMLQVLKCRQWDKIVASIRSCN